MDEGSGVGALAGALLMAGWSHYSYHSKNDDTFHYGPALPERAYWRLGAPPTVWLMATGAFVGYRPTAGRIVLGVVGLCIGNLWIIEGGMKSEKEELRVKEAKRNSRRRRGIRDGDE